MCLHRLKTVERFAFHAFYVHCNAHCLNAVLVNAVKSVPQAVKDSAGEKQKLCLSIWLVRSSQVARRSERAESAAAARGTTEIYGGKAGMQIRGMP